MDKSFSESNLTGLNDAKTPPNYGTLHSFTKRRRDDDYLANLNDFKTEIKEILYGLKTTQDTIMPTLKEMQVTNVNIESSISFLTEQNKELKEKIDKLEKQTKDDKEHILLLESKIEDLQRINYKASIEIKNVPKKINETKEDLINMTSTLAKNINCKIDTINIRDIYRVKQKRNSQIMNTPIVVEMNSTLLKTEILHKCKKFNIKNKEKIRAKHLRFNTDEETPVYVSEQLTTRASRLYFLARELARSNNYRFCWTSFGKVFMRRDDNSPIITIRSEAHIHNLKQGN